MTNSAKRMINIYSRELCLKAYELAEEKGHGGRGVGFELNVSTNTADALINAGREIIKDL